MKTDWRIRAAQQKDLPSLEELWRLCFHQDGEAFVRWYFKEYIALSETIVAIDSHNHVVGSAQLIRQILVRNGLQQPAVYIVGVNCLPEYRGSGVVSALMDWICKESGEGVLLLMPFEAGFYSPMGFVFFDWHGHLTLDIHELKPLSQRGDGQIFREKSNHQKDTVDRLNRLYEVYQNRYFSWYPQRDVRRWRSILDDLSLEDGIMAIYQHSDGRDGGYALYRLAGETLQIREMAYDSLDAQKALYYYIYAHRSQIQKLSWSAPLHETLVRFRGRDKAQVALYPFLMIRLQEPTQLGFFADHLPPDDIFFAVIDDDNQKKYYRWLKDSTTILIEDGAERTINADLTVHIPLLNEMVFSEKPVMDLLEDMGIECVDEHMTRTFISLFAGRKTYFNEYF